MFQSTHPHGCDTTTSIGTSNAFCFNPRTRTGCDGGDRWTRERFSEFQSTHPHGVRPFPGWSISLLAGFNPRTRTGATISEGFLLSPICFNPRTRMRARLVAVPVACRLAYVSIHAPARGGDNHAKHSRGGRSCFNPRTHTRVRHGLSRRPARLFRFNPRTHTRVRHGLSRRPARLFLFQSTHPYEGATSTHNIMSAPQIVSIHAPARGATDPLQ